MGGVKDTLFGKTSKEKSESGNLNNTLLTGSLSPALSYLTNGGDMVGSLLGVNGGPAQTAGLDNFANSGGMNFLREQGTRQINSSAAARGLLKSGSTLKGLERYGQGLGQTYLNQYLDKLLDFSRLGLGAGGVLASSGAYSKGNASGPKQGLLSSFAQGAGQAAAAGGGGG